MTGWQKYFVECKPEVKRCYDEQIYWLVLKWTQHSHRSADAALKLSRFMAKAGQANSRCTRISDITYGQATRRVKGLPRGHHYMSFIVHKFRLKRLSRESPLHKLCCA
jgi:hypothetical protein